MGMCIKALNENLTLMRVGFLTTKKLFAEEILKLNSKIQNSNLKFNMSEGLSQERESNSDSEKSDCEKDYTQYSSSPKMKSMS